MIDYLAITLVLIGAVLNIWGISHILQHFSVVQITDYMLLNGFLVWSVGVIAFSTFHLYITRVKKESYSATGFLFCLALVLNPLIGIVLYVISLVWGLKEKIFGK